MRLSARAREFESHRFRQLSLENAVFSRLFSFLCSSLRLNLNRKSSVKSQAYSTYTLETISPKKPCGISVWKVSTDKSKPLVQSITICFAFSRSPNILYNIKSLFTLRQFGIRTCAELFAGIGKKQQIISFQFIDFLPIMWYTIIKARRRKHELSFRIRNGEKMEYI